MSQREKFTTDVDRNYHFTRSPYEAVDFRFDALIAWFHQHVARAE
jgi:hypothetical protein